MGSKSDGLVPLLATAAAIYFTGGAAAGTAAAGRGADGTATAGTAAATTTGTSLLYGATALSAVSSLHAGAAQASNLKQQAQVEEFNAKNREIDRKRNLIRALSLQNVRGATSGTYGGKGSSQDALMREDISRFELDQATDAATTTQRTTQLRENANIAQASSLLSAASEGITAYSRSKKRGKV